MAQDEQIENEELGEQESCEAVDEKSEPTCEEQLAALNDKYLRTHAEFENIKKRLEREKYQAIDYANEKFARDLLGVIDTLDLALKATQGEDANIEKIQEGLALTIDNMAKVLERHGITEVEISEGFDPNLHEAVMQAPSADHNDNDIVMVLQKGYKYRERTMRPALVSVCKN
jgi:molecular chaperone GrpE